MHLSIISTFNSSSKFEYIVNLEMKRETSFTMRVGYNSDYNDEEKGIREIGRLEHLVITIL